MLTEAQKKANQKYCAKAYDQIKLLVPKGKREEIKAVATAKGLSLNAYIISLIEADIKKEQGN